MKEQNLNFWYFVDLIEYFQMQKELWENKLQKKLERFENLNLPVNTLDYQTLTVNISKQQFGSIHLKSIH